LGGAVVSEDRARVVVFVDYQNVCNWAKRKFHVQGAADSDGHVDPLRLGRLLVSQRRQPSVLQQVRVYRGRPNPDRQPSSASANDRQTAAWEASPLVKVLRRPLQYRSNWPAPGSVSEKGVDVQLATDLVRLALTKRLDAAVVVTSDNDLMPAVETLYDLRLAHVELATWAQAPRLRFPNTQLPWCHFLNELQYRTVQDETDYSARPD